MKTLILLRHAKSSWDHPGLSDFERPLNARGLKNAPKMGRRLAQRQLPIEQYYFQSR
ncbi:SixA phosphatase family protein [Candidatus Venteria ishoeyi]|uniref:SixA phosphatase family protein n=1 Tax=Candidatus Venteria ishoeyi TaxID=1899563 RepID=UPI0011B01F06|nr:histidine phosphatase family protein [Candidatus Venteria ishoeyi]